METLASTARGPASEPTNGHEPDRRRFTIAALTGLSVAAIPFLWVLWDGRLDPLRRYPSGYFSNFYDLQARALVHGHWWVPKGSLGIEAFVVGGRDYMYFGPFPALLRMPVLALTHSLDGRLTASSMLLAWSLTGLFTALLLWRVRILLRGPAALGRAEAASIAVVIATIMSGSVLLYLAALPAVYYEALAWSVALTVGALFALLGVLERPSIGRVVAVAALTLAAVLTRSTTGWACVIGALLAAGWFGVGRGGAENRRWWLPLLAAGLIPLAAGCAVTWTKFGGPFNLPYTHQVFTRVNAHRRVFLAANGGRVYSFDFLPSTVLAYVRPDALRFSWNFPFITLPAAPPPVVGDVVLDQVRRTSSVPASMPLLFLLGSCGLVSAFRRRRPRHARLLRIPLVAAAAGTIGVLVWEGIDNRFLADFMPLLVLAGAVGVVDIWRRLDGRDRRTRGAVLTAVAAIGCFGLAANLGVATQAGRVVSEGERLRDYVAIQKSVGDFTGHRLKVTRGPHLPGWAPAGELFVVGDCADLYISTGERDTPGWVLVESDRAVTLDVMHQEPDQSRIPRVTVGKTPLRTVPVEDRGIVGLPASASAVLHPRSQAPGGPHLPVTMVDQSEAKPTLCRSLIGPKAK